MMHQLSRCRSATPTQETSRRLDIPPQPAKPKIQRSLTACLPNLLNTYCCHTLGVACTAGHLWLYLRPSPPHQTASVFLCTDLSSLEQSLWSSSIPSIGVVPIAKPNQATEVSNSVNTTFIGTWTLCSMTWWGQGWRGVDLVLLTSSTAKPLPSALVLTPTCLISNLPLDLGQEPFIDR